MNPILLRITGRRFSHTSWCFSICTLLFAITQSTGQPLPGTVLWTFDTPDQIVAAPTVDSDGTVYVATWSELHAITNAGGYGSDKWIYFGQNFCGTTAAGDGTLYVAGTDPSFSALNSNGTLKWKYPFPAGSSPPAIGFDNTVYVVSGGSLNALTSGGDKKWSLEIWTGNAAPVIGADGTIYVRTDQDPSTLYAVDPSGIIKWSTLVGRGGAYATDSPAIGEDSSIFVSGGELFRLSRAGTLLWSSGGSDFGLSPVLGAADTIYASSDHGAALLSLTPFGQTNWQVNMPGNCIWHACFPSVAPALDSDGALYYCASNSIFAISSGGDVQWVVGSPAAGSYSPVSATSPAIGLDGTLYATVSNRLYAIATGAHSPAESSWPMYRQNARHTGKVEKPSLHQPTQLPDGSFSFQVMSQIDRPFSIEVSTNLQTWSNFTNVLCTHVPMTLMDFAATNSHTKFYRVQSPL